VPEGEPELLTRTENGVLWITLNRPEAQNALTWPMRDGIADLMEQASADLAVRCVVLTATGKGFCTGADLRSRPAPPERPPGAPERPVGDAARIIRRGWQRLIGTILDCEKPVIAAVNGTAAGGGMQLALACDLVIMAEEARIISVFVRRGLIPDGGGAWILPRLVGLQKAREIMFFGDDVSAADALSLGIANLVVPGAELEKAAREWAERLARGPTRAIGVTKRLLNRSLDVDRVTLFEQEADLVEAIATTEDSKEGVASFVERRDPEFKGW
jgi:2-(1,2-epoxy-1,2-dihydrophenyl)acetyl-CoA isomerase